MDTDLAAAKQRFPDRANTIEELARRDDEFRLLCVDLADAEAAARRWEDSVSSRRDERMAEFIELASDLAKEIDAALDEAAIIPFSRRRS